MAEITTVSNEVKKPLSKPSAGGEELKISFFDRLHQLPEEAWETHKVYVYRHWPRISRSDQPHFIDVVRQPVGEAWLLEHHGSGRYSLRLNDKPHTIDTLVAEDHKLDHPLKLKVEELIDCPENERYFELWPEKRKEAQAAGAADASGDAIGTAVRELGRAAGDKPVVEKRSRTCTSKPPAPAMR